VERKGEKKTAPVLKLPERQGSGSERGDVLKVQLDG
jgi:hypothetical protein